MASVIGLVRPPSGICHTFNQKHTVDTFVCESLYSNIWWIHSGTLIYTILCHKFGLKCCFPEFYCSSEKRKPPPKKSWQPLFSPDFCSGESQTVTPEERFLLCPVLVQHFGKRLLFSPQELDGKIDTSIVSVCSMWSYNQDMVMRDPKLDKPRNLFTNLYGAVLWGTCNDVVVMRRPLDVKHRCCMAADCGTGLIDPAALWEKSLKHNTVTAGWRIFNTLQE